MNFPEKIERSTQIKDMAISEYGMSPKAAHVLASEVEKAGEAIDTALKLLNSLKERIEDSDVNCALSAIRQFAGHAGYSNSAMTACSELIAAAGAVSSLLSVA